MAKKKSDHELHSIEFNRDIKRVRYLAASIYPGDGFVPDDKADIPKMLFELLRIVAKYDDRDDREMMIWHAGAVIYPETFEGQGVIEAYVNRANSKARKVVQR